MQIGGSTAPRVVDGIYCQFFQRSFTVLCTRLLNDPRVSLRVVQTTLGRASLRSVNASLGLHYGRTSSLVIFRSCSDYAGISETLKDYSCRYNSTISPVTGHFPAPNRTP